MRKNRYPAYHHSNAIRAPLPDHADTLAPAETESHTETKMPVVTDMPALISAMIVLKRLDAYMLSVTTGIPMSNITAYIGGNERALTPSTLHQLQSFVGLTEPGMLTPDRVHVLQCQSRDDFTILADVNHLFAKSLFARIEAPSRRIELRRQYAHAFGNSADSQAVRGLILTQGVELEPANLHPSCQWAGKNGKPASVNAGDLWSRLLAADFSITEFDELFSNRRLSWQEIDMMARIHGVTRREIAEWIESRHPHEGNQAGSPTLHVLQGGQA